MYYTANPVADALSYDDAQEAAQEISEHLADSYRKNIAGGFAQFSTVPYVTGCGKIKQQSVAEAVGDMLADDKIFAKLIDVLKTSQCVQVKGLLKAMQDSYAAVWIDDLVAA